VRASLLRGDDKPFAQQRRSDGKRLGPCRFNGRRRTGQPLVTPTQGLTRLTSWTHSARLADVATSTSRRSRFPTVVGGLKAPRPRPRAWGICGGTARLSTFVELHAAFSLVQCPIEFVLTAALPPSAPRGNQHPNHARPLASSSIPPEPTPADLVRQGSVADALTRTMTRRIEVASTHFWPCPAERPNPARAPWPVSGWLMGAADVK
jgi:hypothetical protein